MVATLGLKSNSGALKKAFFRKPLSAYDNRNAAAFNKIEKGIGSIVAEYARLGTTSGTREQSYYRIRGSGRRML